MKITWSITAIPNGNPFLLPHSGVTTSRKVRFVNKRGRQSALPDSTADSIGKLGIGFSPKPGTTGVYRGVCTLKKRFSKGV